MTHLQHFFKYMSITLVPYDPLGTEAAKWTEMEFKGDLPSYFELLRDEAHYMFHTVMPRKPAGTVSLCASYIAAGFLFLVPIGHIFTPIGCHTFLEVMQRFKLFFFASLGFWSSDAVLAYDIFYQVDEMTVDVDANESGLQEGDDKKEEKNKVNMRYSQALQATIAPRAILLQLVPWLTIWSIFSIATADSAIFANDKGPIGKKANRTTAAITSKLFPKFITFSEGLKRAEEENGGRYKHRQRWIVYLSALRIVFLNSRAIQFGLSVYTTFLSVYMLYYPTNAIVLGSMVIVLLPFAIVQALGLVLILGKTMNLRI